MRGDGARQVIRRSDRVGPSRSLGFGFYPERNMESFQGHLSREVIRSDSYLSLTLAVPLRMYYRAAEIKQEDLFGAIKH